MRVLGMRIDRMHVIMAIVVMMIMIVAMVVIVMMVIVIMRMRDFQSTYPCAERIAQVAIRDIRPRRRSALPFNMMVMALLNCTNLMLKAQDLRAVFAKHTSRRRRVGERRVADPILGCDRNLFAALHRQHLGAIRAGAAVWRWVLAGLLNDPLCECLKHLRMIAQISRLHERDPRIF